MTPGDAVKALIEANEARDIDALLEVLTSDVVYENVGMGVMNGHDEVRALLGPFAELAERVEWEVLRQVEQGNTVMNERVDRFWLEGGKTIEIRVMGVFEVGDDGKVSLWRDYFDVATFNAQMA
jgi:limonene-1,2-epoxide hydrolase